MVLNSHIMISIVYETTTTTTSRLLHACFLCCTDHFLQFLFYLLDPCNQSSYSIL